MSRRGKVPGPGANVAVLRKQRDMSQVRLARAAGISVSLLSKIEVGDRALNQGIAASLARAMDLTLDEVLGKFRVAQADESKLDNLRRAIRRFDIPGESPPDIAGLNSDYAIVKSLARDADLAGLLDRLPTLVTAVTDYAHATDTPSAWNMVTGTYSAVYYLAARHRWLDLAGLAVIRQKTAAQRAMPLAVVSAARDEAGIFLNSGDFEGGLAIVEDGIVQAEANLHGRQKALGLGVLHLRGLTLAGRLRNGVEAERHLAGAWQAAEEFPHDLTNDYGIFGPENTAIHSVATYADLENHQKSVAVVEQLDRKSLESPPTRLANLYIDAARAQLALRNRDAAVCSLEMAWNTAPQKARVHPTSQELLRVLISLHRRSNPTLTVLAKKSGLRI